MIDTSREIHPRRFMFYLHALRDLGQSLEASPADVEKLKPLRESLYRIMGTFAAGRGVLLMANEETGRLEPAVAKGCRPGKDLSCRMTKAEAKALAKNTRPFKPHLPPGGVEKIATALRGGADRAKLTQIAPMANGTHLIGVVLLSDRIDGRELSDFELELLDEMVSVLALRIDEGRTRRKLDAEIKEVRRLNRQMSEIYLETVRALASVIDGPGEDNRPSHSLRVAALSAEIARVLKLPLATRERLYLAGLLHDIGKSMIKQSILDKAESLNERERKEVENHPLAGWEIVSHINFPWGDVAQIIRHHHERLDGRGYPDRLCGSQISVEARILMLAEAFDSMTSDQPWRPRLSFDKIVAQLQENMGIQFEPRIVAALCDAVNEGLDGRNARDEFVSHLQDGFEPDMIRHLLAELRSRVGDWSGSRSAKIVSIEKAAG